jgi:hypothetical protein
MRVKVKNVLYKHKNSYSFLQPEFFIHEGDEVETPKWAKDSLCLTTGDDQWPVRIIERSRVVEIDNSPVSISTDDVAAKTIMVAGSRGETYTVTIDKTGTTCTCKGFQFRGTCKHISQAQ